MSEGLEEQAAVRSVRDGLLLNRGVDDHALQSLGLDRLDGQRCIGGAGQLQAEVEPFGCADQRTQA